MLLNIATRFHVTLKFSIHQVSIILFRHGLCIAHIAGILAEPHSSWYVRSGANYDIPSRSTDKRDADAHFMLKITSLYIGSLTTDILRVGWEGGKGILKLTNQISCTETQSVQQSLGYSTE